MTQSIYGIVNLESRTVSDTVVIEWTDAFADQPARQAKALLRPCETNERYFVLLGGQPRYEGDER